MGTLALKTELQKCADRADQSVLFFLASANFWEIHAKNRRKHAKTGEKQRLFDPNFFVEKNWSVLRDAFKNVLAEFVR